MLSSNVIIKHDDIDCETVNNFFEAYNSNIGLEDDKDTKEEFDIIIKSSDDISEFGIAYIKKEEKIVSGTFYVKIKIPEHKRNIWMLDCIIIIIYTFTLKNYRRQYLNYSIIKGIEDYFNEYRCIYLCEVLNQNYLTDKQIEQEKIYSSITCIDREKFWRKIGFEKCQFDYFNPKPNLNESCNGILEYNTLWIKKNNCYKIKENSILKEIVMFSLYQYFKYGYCANRIEGHKWEAYKLNKESIGKIKGNYVVYK